MKRKNKIVFIIAVTLIMVFLCSVPAFAISESEVQAAVDEQGKNAVTGNIFVWFLCAIAFLKVSQKIYEGDTEAEVPAPIDVLPYFRKVGHLQ